jgi:putative ABC transport system substrate-binding protein
MMIGCRNADPTRWALMLQGLNMRRRTFIALGSAFLALPFPAPAQQQRSPRRIAIMMAASEDDPEGQVRIVGFRQKLQELGWTEGRNLQIDYRWAAGPDRSTTYAAELLRLAPEVIVANGTPALTAVSQATRTVPVVFVVVVDPIGAGFVRNLARPGGNITGFSTFEPEMGTKWLALLKEASPNLGRVAVIWDPGFKGFFTLWRAIEGAAIGLGLEVSSVPFHDRSDDIESTVAGFAQQPGGGLITLPTTLNHVNRQRIFSLAVRHQLPAVYPFRHYATDGGLMAYGFDTTDLFRKSALYVDRILRGESPADLPVQAPAKFELIVNLRTAKAIGLTIPESFLLRADALID